MTSQDALPGDISSYFGNDETPTELVVTLSAYTDAVYCTAFPNLKSARIKFPYIEGTPVIDVCKQDLKVLMNAYMNGRDMYGRTRRQDRWLKSFLQCDWELTFGPAYIRYNDGCISAKSSTTSCTESELLCIGIYYASHKDMIRCIILPEDFTEDCIQAIEDSQRIHSVYIHLSEDNHKDVANLCNVHSLQEISLVKGHIITQDVVRLSTDLVTSVIPQSSYIRTLGLPVSIDSDNDVRVIRQRFPKLQKLSYYVSSDSSYTCTDTSIPISTSDTSSTKIIKTFKAYYGRSLELTRIT